MLSVIYTAICSHYKSPTDLRSGARDTSAIKPKAGISSQWCRRLMFSNAGKMSHFLSQLCRRRMGITFEGYFECFAAHAFSSNVFVLGRF